jgi:tetratricopeptide (TPR) repeat protein
VSPIKNLDPDQWARLSEHLDRALELADRERAEYLAALELSDAAAAADLRRVIALREQRGFGSFLAEPQRLIAAAAAAANLLGRRLGSYEIDAQIGGGGMGSVWRARRADGRFEGRVAVKLLNAALVGQPAEQRFIREGNVLANLQHPNIAHLLDAGVAPTGQAYLVLEYVEGERIDQYCETRALNTKARIRLFLDVLAAVAYAHSQLIVHRDLKPSNIMVTDDGAVKLLDFGIAALLAPEDPAAAAALTAEVGSAFTPEYAAPEQLLNGPVTTATDVYALGLVLFVLLAGRHPHAAAGDSAVERIRTVVDQDAPLASQAAPGAAIARTLRGDLDNIIAKALKREPLERYPTAEAFADDLRRFLASEPVRARPDTFGYRAGKFMARYRGGVITGMLAAVGLVGLSGFAWLQMREAQAQRNEALVQQQRAETETGFVTLMLGAVAEGNKPLTMIEILDRSLVLLDQHYGNDPPFVVHTLINMSGRFMDAGNTDREYATLLKAERLARQSGDPALLAEVQCDTVETEIAAGRMTEAAARLRDGQQALARLAAPDPSLAVECLHAAGSLADASGDTQRAIDNVRQAVATLERAGMQGVGGNQYPGLLSHLSVLYHESGDEQRGLEYSLKTLQAFEERGGGESAGANAALHNIAGSLREFGEIREALAREARVANRPQSTDASQAIHPAVSASYGELLGRMGQLSAGRAWLDRAVRDAATTGNVSFELSARLRRARLLVQLHDLSGAAADLAEVDRRVHGRETLFRDMVGGATLGRANYQLASGRPDAAVATLAPLLDAVPRPLQAASGMLNLRVLLLASRIELARNHPDAARLLAGDALELARLKARRPAASADVGEACLLQAAILRKQGATAAARESARCAIESLTNGLGPAHALTLEAKALAI